MKTRSTNQSDQSVLTMLVDSVFCEHRVCAVRHVLAEKQGGALRRAAVEQEQVTVRISLMLGQTPTLVNKEPLTSLFLL